MTDLCSIGPVSITQAMLWDNNNFSITSGSNKTTTYGTTIFTKGQFESSESFEVICTFDEAFQLKGLVEIGEPVFIDASTDLTDNDYFQHKGWYLLTDIDFEHLNATYMKCSIDCQFISSYSNEYLTMDYSTGYYDGIALDYTYIPTSNVYQLQDDGSTVNNFDSIYEYEYPNGGNPTTSAASDGAEIDIQVASTVDGQLSIGWLKTTAKYTVPCTIETVLDRNSLPGAGSRNAQMGFGISKEVLSQTSQAALKNGAIEWFEYAWTMNSASSYDYVGSSNSGGWVTHYPWTSVGTANAEMGLKFILELDGTIEVLTDYDTTGTWTSIYKGPSRIQNLHEGIYIYLLVYNNDSTAFTGSFQKLEIYNSDNIAPEYVTCLPYNATVQTAATGNRAGEDGNIPYYTNPTTELRYTIAQTDMYKGSVKLLSSNNAATTDRQVYNTDAILTPTTTTLKNAFTKITFDADEMILSGYDSGGWQEINKFDYGTGNAITLIKPLLITHDKVVLQVNDTKIVMLRSSPMISLYHPNKALSYVVKDNFYYNGALDTSIAGGDTIAMTDLDDGYYSYTYADAPNDTYRLIFGKKDPTSILSDSLPADDITGIGWNTSTQQGVAGGVNTAAKLVQQWWKQTHTGVSLKQIV